MPVKCENCPLRTNGKAFVPMSRDEVQYMQRFKVGELVVEPGAPILLEGARSPQLFTALYGMGVRYKTTMEGERQVINFIFPGDFIGLQAGIMGEMGHSVEATTRMTLCVFDRTGLWNLYKTHPERAYDLTWLAAAEEHFLGETLVSLGRRDAVEAIAWALVHLYLRAESLGLAKNGRMAFPYRQQDLADALGLSLVHTNKTLAKLRQRQLANWSGNQLAIHDTEALARVANCENNPPKLRPLM